MGKVHATIDEKLANWLSAQKVFFVATAPLSSHGHINCSPKDGASFRILDEQTVVYLDLTGSGVETIAHLKENGRIVLMFCAMEGPPKIVRLHGQGEPIEPKHPDFESLRARFKDGLGLRAFIRIRLTRISDSCGFGVPLYEFRGERSQLKEWAERKGEDSLAEYREAKNSRSIDGLPGAS
ncbi:MAG: pyridoxamine 5'-phosphate oxidase family protein [Verrucomicrobia bacterium]|nr:pyridoxamine 5'-phosphate oxidase family protein [Verrucomicrobiota bacterium]MBV8278561.1 pyridoxamine 5'-phosphate oxidase family protein [Verrucomicrobiota bacterium]